MKINVLITLSMLLICLVLGFSGLYVMYSAENIVKESIIENKLNSIENARQSFEKEIKEKEAFFIAVLAEKYHQDFLRQSNKDFESIPNMQNQIDNIDLEWSSSDEYSKIKENRISADLIAIQKSTIIEGQTTYAEIFLTNKYGAVAALTSKTSDYRQDDEEWWTEARDKGVHISEAHYDPSANTHSIDLSLRVDDKNGNFLGVLKAVISLENAFKSTDNLKERVERYGGEVYILNKDELVIYTTDNFEPFKTHIESLPIVLPKNNAQISEFLHNNERNLGIFSKPKNTENNIDWTYVVVLNKNLALREIKKIENRFVIVILIEIILAIVMGIIIASLISRPIREISKLVQEITKGNLESRITTKSRIAEIKSLISSLERIITSMKISVLESRKKSDLALKGEKIKKVKEIQDNEDGKEDQESYEEDEQENGESFEIAKSSKSTKKNTKKISVSKTKNKEQKQIKQGKKSLVKSKRSESSKKIKAAKETLKRTQEREIQSKTNAKKESRSSSKKQKGQTSKKRK